MTTVRSLFRIVAAAAVLAGLCAPAQAALIHYWEFDETGGTTAYDSVGNLHLTLQGGANFTYDAAFGNYVLNLPTSKTDYAGTTAGVPFTSDITHTIGLWVYHASSNSPYRYQGWISWGKSGSRYFFGTGGGYNSGRVWTGIVDKTFSFTKDPETIPLQETWQYWTIVREGNAARLYLNGVLLETVTGTTSGSISGAEEFRIGRYFGDFSETAGGKRIAQVAIWNEALADWQIRNAMQLGALNYNVPEPASGVLMLMAGLGMLAWQVVRRRRPPQPNISFSIEPEKGFFPLNAMAPSNCPSSPRHGFDRMRL